MSLPERRGYQRWCRLWAADTEAHDEARAEVSDAEAHDEAHDEAN